MSVLRDILPKNENMTAFLKTPQAQLVICICYKQLKKSDKV